MTKYKALIEIVGMPTIQVLAENSGGGAVHGVLQIIGWKEDDRMTAFLSASDMDVLIDSLQAARHYVKQ